jgi:hypothetical protein
MASRLVALGGRLVQRAALRHPDRPGTGASDGTSIIADITLRTTFMYVGASIARSSFS